MTKVILSFQQKQHLFNALRDALEYVGPSEVMYRDGGDDASLAEAVSLAHGFACTKANVAGLRKECFGNLVAGRPSATANAALEARVAELESRVVTLMQWLQKEFPMNRKLAELAEAWND